MPSRHWARNVSFGILFITLVTSTLGSLSKPFDFDTLEELTDNQIHDRLSHGGIIQTRVKNSTECNRNKCPHMIGTTKVMVSNNEGLQHK